MNAAALTRLRACVGAGEAMAVGPDKLAEGAGCVARLALQIRSAVLADGGIGACGKANDEQRRDCGREGNLGHVSLLRNSST
jgi:hypothetical protein